MANVVPIDPRTTHQKAVEFSSSPLPQRTLTLSAEIKAHKLENSTIEFQLVD